MLRAGSIIQRSELALFVQSSSRLTNVRSLANPKSGIAPDTEIQRLVQEFGRQTPRPGSPVSDPDSEETAVTTGSQEKASRSRRNSAMTRRASLLTPQEQRELTRNSSKKSKKAKEARAVGSVNRKVYKEYIKANGYPGVIAYLATLGLVQFISIMTNVWLKNWSQVRHAAPLCRSRVPYLHCIVAQ